MSPKLTSKQYLFQLNLIYGAQAFTILMLAAVVFIMNQSATPSENPTSSLLVYILVPVVFSSLLAAHFIFNLMIRRIDKTMLLRNKLQKYFTAVLVRSAVLEFSGLFALVVSIVTGSQLPLMAVLLILIIFFLFRPTTGQIIQDLKLSHQEKGVLEYPESILAE